MDDRTLPRSPGLGPLLFLRGIEEDGVSLAVVAVRPEAGADPVLETERGTVTPALLARRGGRRLLGYRFVLPARADARYRFDGEDYAVSADLAGDLRLAYVSCNGKERGDTERDPAERNGLWARLAEEHRRAPFQLLLQGGDQVYADEVVEAHPLVAAWARGEGWSEPLDLATAGAVREALAEAYLARYETIFAQPETAWVMARVPSLAMWDDHDIVDGWGSLPAAQLDAPVGRALFEAAREAFLLFQFGAAPDAPPETVADRTGASLGWHVALPGLDIVAPDLRSERRPDRVLGPTGWTAFEAVLAGCEAERVLVMSSVPALGPRLSLVEKAMNLLPVTNKYEDDLRDQWQSRRHRAEWRRLLRGLTALHDRDGRDVTVLSGEIHLATRATLSGGRTPLHQLVASGIAHPPPPKVFATCLGVLAAFGEAPLPERPIRLEP
ncbi:MAG: alkaline phosphatase D family protein [Paracoccaceae bacterium]